MSMNPLRVSATAAPTFIQEAETAYNTTSPKSTASFDVVAGDILVAFALASDDNLSPVISISGGSLTWTLHETQDTGLGTSAYLRMWSAVVDSDKSMTVTFTRTGGVVQLYGGNVLTFRGSEGVGTTNSTNNGTGSGAPTMNITTASSSSAIIVANADWNAADGSSRTWRTNAGSLTELTYDRNAATHTFYGGYHANAGTAGTYAVGLSAPSGQRYVIGAVEVLGTSDAPPEAPSLTSSSSIGSVNLFWTEPADNGNTLTEYSIYRHSVPFSATSTATQVATTSTTTLSYSDTSASVGTTYYYGVTASSGSGEGSLSNLMVSGPNNGRIIRLMGMRLR